MESSQSRLGELNQILQETLSGNRVVKAFGMERFEVKRFHEAARRLMRENMRWIRYIVLTSPLMDILTPIVVVPLVLYGRNQIKLGVMTLGTFATFIYALIRAYEPVKGFGGVYPQFEQTHGGTKQVFAEFLELQERSSRSISRAHACFLHFRARCSSTTSALPTTRSRRSCVAWTCTRAPVKC